MMPLLFKKMGLENLVIQRVHYSVKKYLAQNKYLEFFWQQLWGKLLIILFILSEYYY